MNECIWTKKAPDEAGWYWKRNLRREEKEGVVVIRKTRGGTLMVGNNVLSDYVAEETYEWAGPLDKPQELSTRRKRDLIEIMYNEPSGDRTCRVVANYLGVSGNDPGLRSIMDRFENAWDAIETPYRDGVSSSTINSEKEEAYDKLMSDTADELLSLIDTRTSASESAVNTNNTPDQHI